MRCFQFLIATCAFFFLPTFVFTSRWCKLNETGPFPRRSFQAVPNDLKRRPLWHARRGKKCTHEWKIGVISIFWRMRKIVWKLRIKRSVQYEKFEKAKSGCRLQLSQDVFRERSKNSSASIASRCSCVGPIASRHTDVVHSCKGSRNVEVSRKSPHPVMTSHDLPWPVERRTSL